MRQIGETVFGTHGAGKLVLDPPPPYPSSHHTVLSYIEVAEGNKTTHLTGGEVRGWVEGVEVVGEWVSKDRYFDYLMGISSEDSIVLVKSRSG